MTKHITLIDFAPLYCRLSAIKVLAANPTLIGTVLGVCFYEHPSQGDDVGLIAIDLSGVAYQTDWYDLPRDGDLVA